MAKSSPENILCVVVVATVVEEKGKRERLGLWMPMPKCPFRAELSVKIAGPDRF